MTKRKLIMPESLEEMFIRLEEIVLANSGANEFEEIFKLIALKLWYELDSNISKTFGQISIEDAEETLLNIRKTWKGVLETSKIELTEQHFYACRNLISQYNLLEYGVDSIDSFFEHIVLRTKKGSKGQFFTPRYIIDFCVRILNPKKGEMILDPACGSGAFLLHADRMISSNDKIEGEGKGIYWGFDFDKDAVRISKLLSYVSMIENCNIYNVNSLINPKVQKRLVKSKSAQKITTIEDYLRVSKMNSSVDIIMTNPPFAGEIIEEDMLEGYEIAYGKNRIERDALFLERCVNLLVDGGRMSIILPDNKFGGREWSELREWLLNTVNIIGVIGLPRNTFMPHTAVKTSILFVEKNNTSRTNDFFIGISEKCGKDSKGNLIYKDSLENSWLNVDHDLDEVELEFKKYIKCKNLRW